MPAFIPDLSVIATFAIAAFVLAITPGPDMALFVSRAVNYGRGHGLAALMGANTGLVFHTTLAALGISVLIVAAPTAFMVLKIVGAVYLVWLAIQAIRSGGGLTVMTETKKPPTLWQSYLTGIGINLLNPKIVLFFVTFLPQFVDRHDVYAPGKLFFLGAEFILVSLPVTIAIIYGAQGLVGLFARSKWFERALNYTFATVFMAFAATILLAEGRR